MKLKEFMKKERYNVKLLAEMSGIENTAISNYINGRISFGKKRAKMLSDAIKGKVSVYDIMFPEVELKEINKKKNRKNQPQQHQCDDCAIAKTST